MYNVHAKCVLNSERNMQIVESILCNFLIRRTVVDALLQYSITIQLYYRYRMKED